ncbi:DUF4870 domain-containing protein [Halopiger djelfimassiliensis]|uniref:DUF4870 domain-containing protein n=1 Tax=Halopiger djelfimassiliensis TaxID=1293047 RepID=UPI00067810AB|nr:DUF4870 domain-containing protein [Halopiger djelfimassiliensis]
MDDSTCGNCGAALDPAANYCAECGVSVHDTTSEYGDPTERRTADPGTSDERTFAAITHLLAAITWVIGPLVVLVATDDAFVEENARNALNWQIAYTAYIIISMVLVLVVFGIVLLAILPLVNFALCVVAAVKANDGEAWEYPLTPRFV